MAIEKSNTEETPIEDSEKIISETDNEKLEYNDILMTLLKLWGESSPDLLNVLLLRD